MTRAKIDPLVAESLPISTDLLRLVGCLDYGFVCRRQDLSCLPRRQLVASIPLPHLLEEFVSRILRAVGSKSITVWHSIEMVLLDVPKKAIDAADDHVRYKLEYEYENAVLTVEHRLSCC
jgi:hypothetical protein